MDTTNQQQQQQHQQPQLRFAEVFWSPSIGFVTAPSTTATTPSTPSQDPVNNTIRRQSSSSTLHVYPSVSNILDGINKIHTNYTQTSLPELDILIKFIKDLIASEELIVTKISALSLALNAGSGVGSKLYSFPLVNMAKSWDTIASNAASISSTVLSHTHYGSSTASSSVNATATDNSSATNNPSNGTSAEQPEVTAIATPAPIPEQESHIKQILESVISSESTVWTSAIREFIQSAKATVLEPLLDFQKQYTKTSSDGKTNMEQMLKRLEKHCQSVYSLRDTYCSKMAIAEGEIAKWRETQSNREGVHGAGGIGEMEILRLFGNGAYTPAELNTIFGKMQKEVAMQDIKYPILGTYKDCLLGADLQRWVNSSTTFMNTKETDALSFLSEMIVQGFIRPISLSRNPNVFQPTTYYQWKKLGIDNEPAHVKAKREADAAEFEYRKTVKLTEHLRMSLESSMVEYMDTMQSLELKRISLMKTSLLTLTQLQTTRWTARKALLERTETCVETIQPTREIQLFIEQNRTGYARFPPVLYEEYHQNNPAKNQVFGVSLKQTYSLTQKPVAPFIRKTLFLLHQAINDAMNSNANGNGNGNTTDTTPSLSTILTQFRQTWTTGSAPLKPIHQLRTELNTNSSGAISTSTLSKYPHDVLIGTLLLYLIELPDSIIPSETYETFKLIYLSKSEEIDSNTRLNSVKSLLSTIHISHFETLKAVIRHLRMICSVVSGVNGEVDMNVVNDLAIHLGCVLHRPDGETRGRALHDRHPVRLVKDLVVAFDLVFDGEVSEGGEGLSKSKSMASVWDQMSDEEVLEVMMEENDLDLGGSVESLRHDNDEEEEVVKSPLSAKQKSTSIESVEDVLKDLGVDDVVIPEGGEDIGEEELEKYLSEAEKMEEVSAKESDTTNEKKEQVENGKEKEKEKEENEKAKDVDVEGKDSFAQVPLSE